MSIDFDFILLSLAAMFYAADVLSSHAKHVNLIIDSKLSIQTVPLMQMPYICVILIVTSGFRIDARKKHIAWEL